jgi:hypothetical protein
MRARIDSKYSRLLAVPASITVMALVGLALIACDPGEAVTIENWTGETVVVFEDDTQIDRLEPGDSQDYGVLTFEGTLTYDVRREDGSVLASRTFTWDEITGEDGITIVVEE